MMYKLIANQNAMIQQMSPQRDSSLDPTSMLLDDRMGSLRGAREREVYHRLIHEKPEKVIPQVNPRDYWDVMQEEAENEELRGHHASPAEQQQRSE